jgi:hypothetical protein
MLLKAPASGQSMMRTGLDQRGRIRIGDPQRESGVGIFIVCWF